MLANFSNLITFSRGSNATVTDASGRLTYAANNLVTNSQDFEAAAWTKLATTVASNAIAAPDGSITADTVTEAASTTWHGVFTGSPPTIVSGQNYTLSVYLKAGTRRYVQLALGALGAGQQQNFGVVVDTGVTPMQIVSTGNGTSGTYVASSVQDAGSGWYRISVTGSVVYTSGFFSVSGAAGDTYSINPVNNGSGTYSVWGAQLEAVTYQTTPSPYVSTSVANLLGFSEAFDNAAWSKTNTAVVVGAAQNPINNLWNAQKLMATASTALHSVAQDVTINSTYPFTFSAYVKAAEYSTGALVLTGLTSPFPEIVASFNLSNGTVTAIGTAATASIVAVGNGWFRVSLSGYTGQSGLHRAYIRPNSALSYTGDGNSGIYIYGAQLSNSGSLDPYVPTPGAAPSSTAYYGPRFDYDPVTLAAKGILIEEQRTNLLLQSETFSTTWAAFGYTLPKSYAAPSGTNTATKVIPDSGTTLANNLLRQDVSKAASAITYTFSVFAKADGYNRMQLLVRDTASGANYARATFNLGTKTASAAPNFAGTFTAASASYEDAGNGFIRYNLTFTTGTETSIRPTVIALDATASTGDGTSGILIYGAQLEAGAFATSYIPTVASQVTRSADVASITGSLFSQWYRQDEGTLVAETTRLAIGSADAISASLFTDGNNTIEAFVKNADNRLYAAVGGAIQVNLIDANKVSAGVPFKTSAAYRLNDYAMATGGGTVLTDTSATVPTATTLGIGSRSGSLLFNGYIRNITYIPNRISNDQLQAATS